MLMWKKYQEARAYNFSETSFIYLMQKRIYKVLIICSNYDFYMLEEDGRIDEQIFNEYVSLNLSSPPVFIQADTVEKAFQILNNQEIDLVITMLSVGSFAGFELSREIKSYFPSKPIVVLTPFSREVTMRLAKEDLSAIDYVFGWLGDTEILLAIIKLIEDKMNVANDVANVGVQTILLVEDSIRFYSSYLPNMYKIILKQSRSFMTEGLNDHKEMLRMRGRPKILLATTYDDAIALYEKYKSNMLGIISDIRYSREGKSDAKAGFRLYQRVKSDDKNMPFVLQSSDLENGRIARTMNIDFIYKYSKKLSHELREYIFKNLAFGDFIFRDGETFEQLAKASSLQELHRKILKIPIHSLRHHFNRNDFSRWLNARALFPIAKLFKNLTLNDFESVEEARAYILRAISSYRINKGRGVIAKFDRKTYDEYLIFTRIGEGSLGGKARGLAFVDSFIKDKGICYKYNDLIVSIPRTIVLSTDIFDEFMLSNQLYSVALADLPDEEILNHFLAGKFPEERIKDLRAVLNVIESPLAIRSSSLLEDSHYQPFAGIYSTYMIPYIENQEKMLDMLIQAIKSVYASVYYKSSKAYMEATSNVIDEEKMAIILQEVCGNNYDGLFYPAASGVARSINFYPIPPEKPKDGIVKLAFGLGKMAVEGGITLRFTPKFPKKIIQLSTTDMALKNTQKYFYALDLNPEHFKASIDDSINITKMNIRRAEKHNSMKYAASTYDFQNHIIRNGSRYKGKKIITFANVLQHDVFPLAEILDDLLKIGQREMNSPIEIEFAVNLDVPKGRPKIFNFLQIRPIVETHESIDFDLSEIDKKEAIVYSENALGNGTIDNIYDFVYVKPEAFDPSKNKEIAVKVENINKKIIADKKNYILVGPGRWGTSDPWLGIPVKWHQISAARLIVESGLKNYRIDPSQGTHFFQNLTSFRVGYFTINPYINDGLFDLEYLNNFEAAYEDEFLRHVHFQHPLTIKIDGRHNIGAVLKNHEKK